MGWYVEKNATNLPRSYCVTWHRGTTGRWIYRTAFLAFFLFLTAFLVFFVFDRVFLVIFVFDRVSCLFVFDRMSCLYRLWPHFFSMFFCFCGKSVDTCNTSRPAPKTKRSQKGDVILGLSFFVPVESLTFSRALYLWTAVDAVPSLSPFSNRLSVRSTSTWFLLWCLRVQTRGTAEALNCKRTLIRGEVVSCRALIYLLTSFVYLFDVWVARQGPRVVWSNLPRKIVGTKRLLSSRGYKYGDCILY